MRRSRFTSVAAVALLVAACSGTTPTPIIITAPPVVQPTPQIITPGPVVQPTPIIITAPPGGTPIIITPEPTVAPTPSPTAGPPALPSTPTGWAELDQALSDAKPFKGKRVTIQTQWIGGEGANFDAATADFEAATGIDLVQESIASQHEFVLRSRIDGNTPPDLAMLAQPSAVVEYGARGKTTNVATFMDATKLNAQFGAGFGTALVSSKNGEIWGIPFKVDVKSTIWYPIKAFAAKNYEVPKTWEAMKALEAKIKSDGNGSPWCLGIKDGQATGWIATDWLEDVMLRTAGVDAYNKWITHDLKFDSPEVRAALDVIKEAWFTEGYVYNGYQAITATDRLEGWDPMFAPDNNWDGFTPKCWMHRQATWLGPDFFPDKRASSDPSYQSMYKLGEDIGIMYFPEIDPAKGKPALGAGDTLMVLVDKPESRAVAEFLSTPQGLQRWIERGSAISANQTTPQEWYAGAYKLDVAAKIVSESTSFGFDASDLMPPEANRAFWDGISAWIDAGGTDDATNTFVQAVDTAWPAQ